MLGWPAWAWQQCFKHQNVHSSTMYRLSSLAGGCKYFMMAYMLGGELLEQVLQKGRGRLRSIAALVDGRAPFLVRRVPPRAAASFRHVLRNPLQHLPACALNLHLLNTLPCQPLEPCMPFLQGTAGSPPWKMGICIRWKMGF